MMDPLSHENRSHIVIIKTTKSLVLILTAPYPTANDVAKKDKTTDDELGGVQPGALVVVRGRQEENGRGGDGPDRGPPVAVAFAVAVAVE
jgi:hypothetical protein